MIQLSYSNLGKGLLPLLVLIFSLLGVVNIQLSWVEKEQQTENIEDYWRQANKKQMMLDFISKSPSLGFDNLIANWLFLDFVEYYGNNRAREVTGYELAPDYFTSIIHLDPRFTIAYLFLEPASTLFALTPLTSVKNLEYGLNFISPETLLSTDLWVIKATNEILFLNDIESAKKSYYTALEWSKVEGSLVSPAYINILQRKVEFLKTNPDSRKVAAAAWASLLENARDGKTIAKILEQLNNLGAEVTSTSYGVSVKLPDDLEKKLELTE